MAKIKGLGTPPTNKPVESSTYYTAGVKPTPQKGTPLAPEAYEQPHQTLFRQAMEKLFGRK